MRRAILLGSVLGGGASSTPQTEIAWDDGNILAWDDGTFIAWD